MDRCIHCDIKMYEVEELGRGYVRYECPKCKLVMVAAYS